MSPRLLVTDPSPVFRSSLRQLLEAEVPEWEIVGEVATAGEAVSALRRLEPDAVLLERHLGDDDGLRALSRLREARPGVQILMISIDWEPPVRRAALERGARDVVLKDDADHLVEVLREVGRDADGRREAEPGLR